jgi:hypothetical protein
MTISSSAFYRPYGPRDPAVKSRLECFDEVNRRIMARGGWVTSLPGAPRVTVEALPSSPIAAELRHAGYEVRDDGDGERILPTGIVEKLTLSASGALVPLTPGSTLPVASTVTHAGICRVSRFSFALDPASRVLHRG